MNFFKRKKPERSPGGSNIHKHPAANEKKRLGFSSAPAEWGEYRYELYQKFLGSSEDISVLHEIVPVIPHIDIYIFPPSEQMKRNYYTLITSGMSDERMKLPQGVSKKFSRAELIFYVSPDEKMNINNISLQNGQPWYCQAMSFLARFPFDYNTSLTRGDTIPNGTPPEPFVEGSQLTTALLFPAVFESPEFRENFYLKKEKVNLLWLTYLTDKETEYKLEHGIKKLTAHFNKENMPQIFDAFRPPVI